MFVLPKLWDDPYELTQFDCFQKHISDENNLLTDMNRCRAHAQCWTYLEESDALWRIYDKKGSGVRIQIKTQNAYGLSRFPNAVCTTPQTDYIAPDSVDVVNVKYVNDLKSVDWKSIVGSDFNQLFGIKRKAFEHENEVRLIVSYPIPFHFDGEKELGEMNKHIAAAKLASQRDQLEKAMPPDELGLVDRLLFETGFVGLPDTKAMYFGHILNFIESVMLSPFAPSWLEDTLDSLCKNYNTKFLGKSKLYTLDED